MNQPVQTISPSDLIAQRDRLATDLEAMTLLHGISTRFVQEGNTHSLFHQAVGAALDIAGADMGNIHILDEPGGKLRLVACRSLGMPLPQCCKQMDKDQAFCGIAVSRSERLIFEDLTQGEPPLSAAGLDKLLAVGVRAVQSLPLFTRSGRLVGVMSTHCRIPRRLDDTKLRLLDMLARQIADIVERSQANEALKKSMERHRSLFENMLDAYSHCRLVYRDGRPVDFEFLAVNPAFERLTGFKEVEGKRVSQLIPGIHRDNPELFSLYGRVVESGEPTRFEIHIQALAAWFSVAAYRPAPGEFVAVFDNITEKKRLEQELQNRRSEMEALVKHQVAAQTAAAIAHDLNQPLVAISAYSEVALEMLRHGVTNSEKLSHALEGSVEQAQRAGRTLHDLLDFLHHGDTESTAMDLNEAVADAVALVQANGRPDFLPSLDLDPALPPVLGNRIQVQKVLENLLHNGLEAMAGAGMPAAAMAISIHSLAGTDMARVTVRDNGPGIAPAAFPRLFEPFFTTKCEGIGLGLAICRSLIEAHGGKLWAEPAAPSGATFHFTLPFAS